MDGGAFGASHNMIHSRPNRASLTTDELRQHDCLFPERALCNRNLLRGSVGAYGGVRITQRDSGKELRVVCPHAHLQAARGGCIPSFVEVASNVAC